MERRQSERCPVCQGPTKSEKDMLVCRNSLCSFNHEQVLCPRCSSKGRCEASAYQDGSFSYICRDCQHRFHL